MYIHVHVHEYTFTCVYVYMYVNLHVHVHECTFTCTCIYMYIRNANNIMSELNNRERRLYIFTFILDTSNFPTHQGGFTMHNSRSLLQCRDFVIIMHATCTAETKCDPIFEKEHFPAK